MFDLSYWCMSSAFRRACWCRSRLAQARKILSPKKPEKNNKRYKKATPAVLELEVHALSFPWYHLPYAPWSSQPPLPTPFLTASPLVSQPDFSGYDCLFSLQGPPLATAFGRHSSWVYKRDLTRSPSQGGYLHKQAAIARWPRACKVYKQWKICWGQGGGLLGVWGLSGGQRGTLS